MVLNKAIKIIQEFIRLEAAGGIVLFIMALLAIIIDNSTFRPYYEALLSLPFTLKLGLFNLSKPLVSWVNDGLMTIFFFLVGLEIKREMLVGELNSAAKMTLPGIAAISGMIFPAIIYFLINKNNAIALRGWAIPTATDIAFVLGILKLLGKRVPESLKVLLIAIAILDDLGAIVIIAGFYTVHISYLFLSLAVLTVIALAIFNFFDISNFVPYIVAGLVLWVFVLKSGIHPTLSGVTLAMAIPLKSKNHRVSPLHVLEHSLHPWVAFGVLPIFAFFNAGLPLNGVSVATLLQSIPLGIALGLFLGKPIGIFFSSWLAVKLGLAKLPRDIDWHWFFSLAILCGVGFTMSLFIGNLAFNLNPVYYVQVRIGVIAALISGLLGYLLLLGKSKCARRENNRAINFEDIHKPNV